jgi:nucleoside-diphosphate-sugar epimerase
LYANNSDIKINILRPFNVFGIGQNDEFLIPTIIRQAIYQNVIELNDLSPKRDYLYIDDMVDALISAMKYKDKSSTYNIGSGKSFSVSEIADLVLDVLGIRKPVHAKKILRQNEIPDTVADISQAKADLNWQPHHTLKEGIEKILRSEKNKHNEQTIHPN